MADMSAKPGQKRPWPGRAQAGVSRQEQAPWPRPTGNGGGPGPSADNEGSDARAGLHQR